MSGGFAWLYLAKFLRYLARYGSQIQSILVILIVLTVEWAITTYVFSCPCFLAGSDGHIPDMRVVYASLFIGAPALIFWIIGKWIVLILKPL